MILSRRHFLLSSAGAACVAAFPDIAVSALAGVNPTKKVVAVHMNGALDQLSALIPYADAGYYNKYRPGSSFGTHGDASSVISLSDRLGLHPDFVNLGKLANGASKGGMALVSGIGADVSGRSHFLNTTVVSRGLDETLMNDPEIGSSEEFTSGFLGRLSAHIAPVGNAVSAYEIDTASSEIFIHPDKQSVLMTPPASQDSLPPERLLEVLSSIYKDVNTPLYDVAVADKKLMDTHLASLSDEDRALLAKGYSTDGAQAKFAVIAELIGQAEGANLVFTKIEGFDTHANIRTVVPKLITEIDTAIGELQKSPGWTDTIVIFFSEFGRRVEGNGSGGSDHGLGGIAIVAGGGMSGANIINEDFWSTDLSDNRLPDGDLPLLTDYRAVFKTILGLHLGVESALLEEVIFPRSEHISPIAL